MYAVHDHGGTEYDFELHGADWAVQFEDCSGEFQSPINLMTPITDYGTSYHFFDFADDKSELTYKTTLDQELSFFQDIHTVEMYLDHKDGYLGFKSELAESIFGATKFWRAYEIQFKHKSEHTINHVRYDAEIQVFHTPRPKELESDLLYRRNLGSLLGDEIKGEGEDHYFIEEQLILKFDFALISILFDSTKYDQSLTDEEVQWFYEFFDDLRLSEKNSII